MAASLLWSACDKPVEQGPETTPAVAGTPDPNATVVVAYPWDALGFNEVLLAPRPLETLLFYFALFQPLFDEYYASPASPAEFRPRIGESYEFSEDRLSLTVRLRPGLVWSDGAPITAEDVRFTWQAQTSPEVAWPLASTKSNLRDVEVVDELTVRAHFHRVDASQLLEFNNGVILPKHAWSKLPFDQWRGNQPWFQENLVVSGPFTLEEWVPRQRIVLRRNERYGVADRPRVERVVLQITPEVAGQLALVRSGQAHVMEGVEPGEAAAIEADPELELLSFPVRQFVFLVWNQRQEPFSDLRVRQALTLAIDRQRIIDSLYYGYAKANTSPYMSESWVSNKELVPWPYDPERARKLLAEAGYSDQDNDGIVERDGKPFSFEMLTIAGNQIRQDILVQVQEQLRLVGVDARTRVVDMGAYLPSLDRGEYEAAIAGLGTDTSLDLSYFFATGSDYNWAGYSSPEVDRLLGEIGNYVERTEAKALYDELQARLHEDLPFTYLYEPQRLVAINHRLRDVRPSLITTYANLQDWWMTTEPQNP